MLLTLLTPHRRLVESVATDEIVVPGVKGELDILEGHANMVTQLETGVVRWKSSSGWTRAAVSFGLLEVFGEKVTILADVSELSQDLDLGRAKAAEQKARTKIEEGGLEDSIYRKVELKLKRAMARQSAASGS
jgi:F-type H+-transporting ATPase subunit epsilon